MNGLKQNWWKVVIALLAMERLYYYIAERPELYKWLDYIIEQVLALSR